MSLQDSFNENDGMLNTMGHMAAINQRNQQIAQQKEQAAAIRAQTAALEKQNRLEADRAQIERQRLEIERKRLEAEELERRMQREQAEQVKQLRNLMADSFDALERLRKIRPVNWSPLVMEDAFLRSVAALQANLKVLESQQDVLSDFQDMQALRRLRSELADYMEGHVDAKELPPDPLKAIGQRLEALGRFFQKVESESNRLLSWRTDWLKGTPSVGLADLEQAKEELAELEQQLDGLQETLRGMLDPRDWIADGDEPELHPELRLCAEVFPSLELPAADSCAVLQGFARGTGRLHDEILKHFRRISHRIDELVQLHGQHAELLREVRDLLGRHEIRSAERRYGELEPGFNDLPYASVEEGFRELREILRKFYVLGSFVEGGRWRRLEEKLPQMRGLILKSDSELGRECLALMQGAEESLSDHVAKRRSKRNREIVGWTLVIAFITAMVFIAIFAGEKAAPDAGGSKPTLPDAIEEGEASGQIPLESESLESGVPNSDLLEKEGLEGEADASSEVVSGEPLNVPGELSRDEFYAEMVGAEEVMVLAQAGDAYAQALVGNSMFFGPHEGLDDEQREKRKSEGMEWLEKSAAQKHPLGLAVRGSAEIAQSGGSGESDARVLYTEAVAAGLLENLEARGPEWIFYASVAYQKGRGVAKDEAEAVKWNRRASEQGYAEAQAYLGYTYQHGIGVARDFAEAVKWFRKAADQELEEAQVRLGLCYDMGLGVPMDNAEAVKWYRKAAERGNAEARHHLGASYLNGSGVARDVTEAVKWYRKAAEQGWASAQYQLGMCYLKGWSVARDEAEAVNWFRKAAEQGHSEALSSIGWCYANGRGVVKDEGEAERWYRKAAEQGSPLEQWRFGRRYSEGDGVPKDEGEAVKWFRVAADRGFAGAQAELGRCYMNGQGVAKNETEAVKWFRKAAAQGDVSGQFALGWCCANGRGVARDRAESVEWYGKAAAQGHQGARKELGLSER